MDLTARPRVGTEHYRRTGVLPCQQYLDADCRIKAGKVGIQLLAAFQPKAFLFSGDWFGPIPNSMLDVSPNVSNHSSRKSTISSYLSLSICIATPIS